MDLSFRRDVAPFPVLDEVGVPYRFPFLGGLDVPRPKFADIDGDGDLDLFVQERTDALMFFENVGSVTAPRFEWRSDRWMDLEIGEWNRFVDLDRDGDLDVLAELPFSYVRYFRNDGTASAPRFAPAGDSLRDNTGSPIFSDRQNLPTVTDIDCDGRWDLFLGRVDGTVRRYEESDPGPGGEPRFRLEAERFEDIQIVAALAPSRRHGANAMAFADLDGDGDEDLFWGDFFESSVLFIENTGSCRGPSLRSQPTPLRTADSLRTSGYNVPAFADLDGDGDLDLYVGVLGGAFNPNRTVADNFLYYENEGGTLHLSSTRFLPSVDVGSESIPELVDLDADGDLDLLVASKIDPHHLQSSRLFRFENVGGPGSPSFRLADTVALHPVYHYAPASGDLDGDGDPDLLVGTWNRGVMLYRNRGSARVPDFVLEDSTYVTLTRGSNATPTLGDVDADGDLDLFVGEASGALNFYRNSGTVADPTFTLESDEYLDVDVGRRSAPRLVDLDGDGDLDLVIGRETGGALLMRNEGTAQVAKWTEAVDMGVQIPAFSTPTFGDMDGDGDLDLISGTLAGGLLYFEARRR